MNGPGTISGLIDSFYDAALEPQLWPAALERLATAFAADISVISSADQITLKGWMLSAGADPAAIPTYFRHFADRNPVRPLRNRAFGVARDQTRWRTTVINDQHVISKPELTRTEYYGEFLRPFGIHSMLIMGLALEGTQFATLNLLRNARGDQFDDSEIACAARLQPHFIRAFALAEKLSGLQRHSAAMSEFLDQSPQALFLVDAFGRVNYRNRAAEELVAANAGLVIRTGRISTVVVREEGKLLAAIAVAGDNDGTRRSGATFVVSRPGRRGLPVIVAPMRLEQASIYSPDPLVMICASDPDAGVVLPAERLQRLYALTPAEAKVAIELLSGAEPKRIAEHHALSIHTVRVHIARILAKTETSRQADLVRLLARVCGMSFDPGANGTTYSNGNPNRFR